MYGQTTQKDKQTYTNTSLLNHHHLLQGRRRGLRPSHLYIVPNVPGELEGEFPALDLTQDALVEIVLERSIQFLVTHGVIVGQLSPQLGHFRWLADLEFKLVVRPLQEVCVGRYQ